MTAQRRRALVCNDDAVTSRAVQAILTRCGFDVVTTVESSAAALLSAELSPPDLVVLDLAVAGDLGVRAIGAFRAAVPRCAIVVLSPFEALRAPALAAGAHAVVSNTGKDLRELEVWLLRLSERPQAGPERARMAKAAPSSSRRSPAD